MAVLEVPTPEEWTDEQSAEWIRWINSRPRVIREAVEKYPPWKKYRIEDGGPACGHIFGYKDCDEGCAVVVKINLCENTLFPRNVGDVPLSKLIEVD